MPESRPLLVVEDLKTYFFTRRGITKAVDGVSFTLQAGETLLRLMLFTHFLTSSQRSL